MDLYDIAISAMVIEPGEELDQVIFQHMFQPMDTGGRKERADGNTPLPMLVMIDGGEDGIGRWRVS